MVFLGIPLLPDFYQLYRIRSLFLVEFLPFQNVSLIFHTIFKLQNLYINLYLCYHRHCCILVKIYENIIELSSILQILSSWFILIFSILCKNYCKYLVKLKIFYYFNLFPCETIPWDKNGSTHCLLLLSFTEIILLRVWCSIKLLNPCVLSLSSYLLILNVNPKRYFVYQVSVINGK